jgi:membrane protein YdbS with pleckstrin-like domain
LHLPLFLAVAAVAGLIGAGKIPLPATHTMLALAGIIILLAIIAHFVRYRRWHGRAQWQHTQ